ncbi:hypothetical protein [Streptomyces sp. CB03238]|uniref:hypothetical protein n=1 Tax=Streptomyces sp. CB03238 TaxID=1907777 RepID=UPI0011817765|nr:hypothetical protein [Streptomyces sp. CB03238]
MTRVRAGRAGDVRSCLEAQGRAEAAVARAAYLTGGIPTPGLAAAVRDADGDVLLIHEVAVRRGVADPALAALVFAAAVDALGAGAGVVLCRPCPRTLSGAVLRQAADRLALRSLPGGVRVADPGQVTVAGLDGEWDGH